MKCIICGASTSVTNSRARSYGVWRRRKCTEGHLFTTTESADMSSVAVSKNTGDTQPFEPTKILISLLQCDLDAAEATELQRTIINHVTSQLSASEQESITSADIAQTVFDTLHAYDKTYATRYASYSDQLDT